VLVGVLVAVLDAGVGGADGDGATARLESETGIDDRAGGNTGSEARIGQRRIGKTKLGGIGSHDRVTGDDLTTVAEARVSDGSRGEESESTGAESEWADHLRSPPWQ
jgi:hypothetical protein